MTFTLTIQKIRRENQTSQGRHGEALQKSAKIFCDTADQVPSTPTHITQTSSAPTASTQIHLSPLTHKHTRRANTPGIITLEKTPQ